MTDLAALLAVQQGLSKLQRPSAEALLQRAFLLMRIAGSLPPAEAKEWSALAEAEAQTALALDPQAPGAAVLLCRLAKRQQRPAHPLALDLLANPFASAAQRREALGALDPKALPLCVAQLGLAYLRLTLVQARDQRSAWHKLGPGDHPHALSAAQDDRLIAVDWFLERQATARSLEVMLQDQATAITVAALPDPKPRPSPLATAAPLWVILPVHNGFHAVQSCLASLQQAVKPLPGAKVLLVDDGSTCPHTKAALEKAARRRDWRLLRKPVAEGFIHAVNHGYAQTGKGPILLLNSDTWLPPGVLPRLLAHLKDGQVGTVTPLSNDAGLVSLAGPDRRLSMPHAALCNALDGAAARAYGGQSVDLPNGNGFCLLIAAQCTAAAFPLSVNFHDGYYEEVDLCLRLKAQGYRNLAAVDCFVGHQGSASYGAAKQGLITANQRRLHLRFPEYGADYARFLARNPLAPLGKALIASLPPHWRSRLRYRKEPPKRERPAQVLELRGPDAPLLIPLLGDAGPFSAQLRARLALIPDHALACHGITLRPIHGLKAREDDGILQIFRAGRPALRFAHRGASAAQIDDFITAVHALCAMPSSDQPELADALSL